MLRLCFLLLLASQSVQALLLPKVGLKSTSKTIPGSLCFETPANPSMALCAEKKGKGGLEENLKQKLITESIAPWRNLRLFLYFALGSGAFIGGLINGSGAIAKSASPDFNLNTEVSTPSIDKLLTFLRLAVELI